MKNRFIAILPPSILSWSIVFVLANVADLISTTVILSIPGVRETNILYQLFGWQVALIGKLSFMLLFPFFAAIVNKGTGRRLGTAYLASIAVTMALAAVWNMGQLHVLRQLMP